MTSGTAPRRLREADQGRSEQRGPYHQWTAKANGKTITRRLTEPEARLYQEWIANDRKLRNIIAQMREEAAKATQLIMAELAGN